MCVCVEVKLLVVFTFIGAHLNRSGVVARICMLEGIIVLYSFLIILCSFGSSDTFFVLWGIRFIHLKCLSVLGCISTDKNVHRFSFVSKFVKNACIWNMDILLMNHNKAKTITNTGVKGGTKAIFIHRN